MKSLSILLTFVLISFFVLLISCSEDATTPSQTATSTTTTQPSTTTTTTTTTLPSVDLRPYMSPVKHQGNFRGTCNAFGATALMECLYYKINSTHIDLSEQYNYWAGKMYTLNNSYLQSCYLHDDGLAGYLAVYAYTYGSMLETDWPYEAQNWQQTGNPLCTSSGGSYAMECFTGTMPTGAPIAPYRIEPSFMALADIHTFILEQQKPVVVNIMWFSNAVNSSGDFHMPSASEIAAGGGGHVILLAGYDANTDKFIFKNSWGSSWGNQGYGTLPRDYLLNYYELYPYDPADYISQPDVYDLLVKGSQGVSGNLILSGTAK